MTTTETSDINVPTLSVEQPAAIEETFPELQSASAASEDERAAAIANSLHPDAVEVQDPELAQLDEDAHEAQLHDGDRKKRRRQKKPYEARDTVKPVSEDRRSVDATPLLERFGGNRYRERPKQMPRLEVRVMPESAVSEYSKNFAAEIKGKDKEDGVDCINVSHMAKTELGRLLEMNAKVPFKHPSFGAFASLGGMWNYLVDPNHSDEFRTMYGGRCRNAGKELKPMRVKGFKRMIAEGCWAKCNGDEKLRALLIQSELPFASFYVQSCGLTVKAVESVWYIPVLETIRSTLKAQHAEGNLELLPDFSFLDRYPERDPRQAQKRF